MRIVVCYKLVPDEQDITVLDNRTLDFSKAPMKIGAYDLNALEAAAGLAQSGEGEFIALTAGADEVNDSKLRKAVLSRGPDQMYGIADEDMKGADSYVTAQVLKAGIEQLGGVDLVLCGEGSGDFYSRQVGSLLGALLGWSNVNGVSALESQGDHLRVERTQELCTEVLDVKLPAVISVTSDINIPRIPGMKDILAAAKKPYTVWTLADINAEVSPASQTVSILAPELTERRQLIIEGDGDEQIDALYEHLQKALKAVV